jgi:hypothetical protein
MLKNIWKHFKRITKHKIYVMKFCFKAGLYWQGITHDLSKYGFTEFSESIKYYKEGISPINVSKRENGWSLAWLHHRGRNLHHDLNWIDEFSNYPHLNIIAMPYNYAVEMLCDFLAAGFVYSGHEDIQQELNWWNKEKETKHFMHPATKKFITDCLEYMVTNKNTDLLTEHKLLKNIYINSFYDGDKKLPVVITL